jgi:hypothetical protein
MLPKNPYKQRARGYGNTVTLFFLSYKNNNNYKRIQVVIRVVRVFGVTLLPLAAALINKGIRGNVWNVTPMLPRVTSPQIVVLPLSLQLICGMGLSGLLGYIGLLGVLVFRFFTPREVICMTGKK